MTAELITLERPGQPGKNEGEPDGLIGPGGTVSPSSPPEQKPAGPPAEDLEDFEVYRSGETVTLRCIQCGKVKNVGRIVLEALVDEAEAHAELCRGPVA